MNGEIISGWDQQVLLKLFNGLTYLLKSDSNTGFPGEYCKSFKNSFFIEHFCWLLLYTALMSLSNKNHCIDLYYK